MEMDWPELQKSTAEYFSNPALVRGITADDILNVSSNPRQLFLGPIDWSWAESDEKLKEILDRTRSAYLSQCNQVETFIGEAGTLIERSLGDVLKYDELNVERFKLLVEFIEFIKNLAQQKNEEGDAEFWDGPANEGNLASKARVAASGDQLQMEKNYKLIANDYKGAHDYWWNQGGDTADVNRWPFQASQYSTINTQLQYDAQVSANKLDSDSRTARSKFEQRSRIHQVARRQIAQEVIALKMSEFQKHGGALNYNERMQAIGTRALNDYYEVQGRLIAIAVGLQEFYDAPDPSEADLNSDLENSRTRIEGAVTWLRKAANTLSRAKMDEQGTIVRVTIDHSPGLLQKIKRGLVFNFSDRLIPNIKRVQLRGLSATIEADQSAWMDFEITSPTQKLRTKNITLPAVTTRLGRSSSSASLNVRDVAGPRPIMNRSPIGNWTLRSLRDHGGHSLRRVDVDFHLAVVRA